MKLKEDSLNKIKQLKSDFENKVNSITNPQNQSNSKQDHPIKHLS